MYSNIKKIFLHPVQSSDISDDDLYRQSVNLKQ